MPSLYDGDFVAQDLERIGADAPEDADKLDAFLTELSGDEDALWKLLQWNAERTYPDPVFNIRALVELQKEGFNLYRIRPLRALRDYRILYAYLPTAHDDAFYVLGIVRKAPEGAPMSEEYYNYERNHPVTLRALEEYDRLGIPRLC